MSEQPINQTREVHHYHHDAHVLKKKWFVALLLSIFLGWLGIDRFYLGHVGLGLAKFFTLGGFGVWALVDVIMIATKNVRGVEWV